MRIAIGSDHRGSDVRERMIDLLKKFGQEVIDLGSLTAGEADGLDLAAQLARQVSQGEVQRGILICGTGVGVCIVANKFPGVRAATCHDELSVEVSRRHNDLNVLCLSDDAAGEQALDRLVEIWLHTAFEGGRHARRLQKIAALERNGH